MTVDESHRPDDSAPWRDLLLVLDNTGGSNINELTTSTIVVVLCGDEISALGEGEEEGQIVLAA